MKLCASDSQCGQDGSLFNMSSSLFAIFSHQKQQKSRPSFRALWVMKKHFRIKISGERSHESSSILKCANKNFKACKYNSIIKCKSVRKQHQSYFYISYFYHLTLTLIWSLLCGYFLVPSKQFLLNGPLCLGMLKTREITVFSLYSFRLFVQVSN